TRIRDRHEVDDHRLARLRVSDSPEHAILRVAWLALDRRCDEAVKVSSACIIAPMLTRRIYRGRRAVVIENSDLRVTLLGEGGHIAEIFDKHAQVNPLWTPGWPSIEPSTYD